MTDSINELSPVIRDFLLSKNLILSDTIIDNGLSAYAIGLGHSSSTSNGTSIIPSIDIEIDGKNHREGSIRNNLYTSNDDMIKATLINNNLNYNQRDGGYLNDKNEINLGGGNTATLDTIDSIISQRGFGLGNNGLENQSDIRTTLSGRILGGSGIINDTPLGIIGGEQLLLALSQRAFFNAQKETLGRVNLQPFSLLSGDDFFVTDNTITVRSTTGGRIADKSLDIIGLEIPRVYIDEEASISNQDSLMRNLTLIKYTGRGQLVRLFEGLNVNQYKPDYQSDSSGRSKLGVKEALEYETENSGTTIYNLNTHTIVKGFIGEPEIFDGTDKIWNPTYIVRDDNTILSKTKKMFNDGVGYQTMFGLQGTPSIDFSQLITPSGGRLSKGSGVLSEDFLIKKGNGEDIGVDNIFCRTWSSTKQYSEVKDLQKNIGLIDYKNKIRNDINDSVLGENGFVKISPYHNLNGEEDVYEAKKFMFSIENLAWNDNIEHLPLFEVGNGDPITGTKGRIMWFPPYDIKFSESTSVNWDSTNFIGRGEPIYTYNNTERSGSLSFKIIIDYPDYMNDNVIDSDELISSIVAGCTDYDKFLSPNEKNAIIETYGPKTNLNREIPSQTINLPKPFNFYFANNVASLTPAGYEVSFSGLTNPTQSEAYNGATIGTTYANDREYGLNDTWNEPNFISDLKKEFKNNGGLKILLKGYASSPGTIEGNLKLSQDRIETVKEWFRSNIGDGVKFLKGRAFGSSMSSNKTEVFSKAVKEERTVSVEFVYDYDNDKQFENVINVQREKNGITGEVINAIQRRFHREDRYFKELEKSDSVLYKTFKEKIKFFQPAFHSTTPEGFNSRLNFLQQCTRQGSTNDGVKSKNLAFGSPPVCILRIGDFYNTKIIIEGLNISYEPILWDMNPEGIGVQPRLANVELSFKFIGGSSLNGPINKLQNAISFNYFANTGVYDPRADRLVRKNNSLGESLFEEKEGLEDLRGALDEFSNFTNKKDDKESNINNNQKEVSELELEKEVIEEPSDIKDDSKFLNELDWNVTYSNIDERFVLNIPSTNIFNDLNGRYKLLLKVLLAGKNNEYGDVQIIYIDKNTVGSMYLSQNTWDSSLYSGYTIDKFSLLITGNNIQPIKLTK